MAPFRGHRHIRCSHAAHVDVLSAVFPDEDDAGDVSAELPFAEGDVSDVLLSAPVSPLLVACEEEDFL